MRGAFAFQRDKRRWIDDLICTVRYLSDRGGALFEVMEYGINGKARRGILSNQPVFSDNIILIFDHIPRSERALFINFCLNMPDYISRLLCLKYRSAAKLYLPKVDGSGVPLLFSHLSSFQCLRTPLPRTPPIYSKHSQHHPISHGPFSALLRNLLTVRLTSSHNPIIISIHPNRLPLP